MAQGTGAERLLRPLAKTTGAGTLSALVATVVLGISGCGGGSAAQTTSSAMESTSATDSKATSAKAKAPSAAEEEQREAAGKVRRAVGDRQTSPRGKQGPEIAVPKGKPEPEITPEQKANSNLANIALSSPATTSGSSLPATYTCDGRDIWPTLEWEGVPPGTAEFALFVMNMQPVDGQIFVDWAVAGLDRFLGSIETGKLPEGAVTGENSFGKVGYSICPSQSKAETYMFVLYALPKALHPEEGFDALDLREKVIDQSGNAGLMVTSYSRS